MTRLVKFVSPLLVAILALASCTNPVTETIDGSGPARAAKGQVRADHTVYIEDEYGFAEFVYYIQAHPTEVVDGILEGDVDITGLTFIPIGTPPAASYTGTFDGQGNKLTINIIEGKSFVGIFGVNNGTIKNLIVEGNIMVDATGGDEIDYVGGVAAYNDVAGTIKNVISRVNINTIDPTNIHSIGGITGFNGWDSYTKTSPHYEQPWEDGGEISECRNEGDVHGGYNKVGGIAGENAWHIEKCSNTGRIYVEKSDTGWIGAGGIAGRNGNNNDPTENATIDYCYNWGQIWDNTTSTTSHNGYGGITGWCNNDSQVKNSYDIGDFYPRPASGQKNPVIGRIDEPAASQGVNIYSLDSVYAESPNEYVLSGDRMEDIDMQNQNFVNLLNGGTTGPFTLVSLRLYPILSWESLNPPPPPSR